MERYLVVWCPDLLEQYELGREERAFARVLEAMEEFSPHVEVIKPGVGALGTRGPSRYFGGDEALAGRVLRSLEAVEVLEGLPQRGITCGVGVADGLFAATLAARSSLDGGTLDEGTGHAVVVPPGATPRFLYSWPVRMLERPELVDLLCRLGVSTLGELADLPAREVLARFGRDGAVCRSVAAGTEGELPGLRTLPRQADARTRGTRARSGRTRTPLEVLPPRQAGFFGADAEAGSRAASAIAEVRRLLGPESVLRGRLQGGRGPAERARLVPWVGPLLGTSSPERRRARPTSSTNLTVTPPWPGKVPPPSPVLVLGTMRRAELVDDAGDPVVVEAGGLVSSPPARLSVDGAAWAEVSGWAGPWPCEELWWSKSRRRCHARMQVLTSTGTAYLLVSRGGWWVQGIYD